MTSSSRSSPVPAIGGERWMIARSPARSRPEQADIARRQRAEGGVIGRALRQPLGRLPAIGGDEPQPDIISVEFPAAIAGDAFDPHLHPFLAGPGRIERRQMRHVGGQRVVPGLGDRAVSASRIPAATEDVTAANRIVGKSVRSGAGIGDVRSQTASVTCGWSIVASTVESRSMRT